MKLAYLVPAPISLSMGKEEAQRRQAFLRQLASLGTTVDLVEAPEGPASIESALEEYLSVPGAALAVERLEKEGYNGAILGCAGDPGLDALREVAGKMIVIGPGETSFLLAASLGRRFGVLTPTRTTIGPTLDQVERAGIAGKLAGVRAVEVPVLEMRTDREATLARVEAAGKAAIEEDGADVLVLGCMSLAFLQVDRELGQRLGVPVVNPVVAGLKLLEAIVSAGLTHSKLAFPRPPKLADGGRGVGALRLVAERGNEQ